MKFTLKKRPKKPVKHKAVLVTTECPNNTFTATKPSVVLDMPIHTASDVIQFCVQSGLPPESVVIEIETESYYGHEEYTLCLYGHREETEEEFTKRVEQYEKDLKIYKTWAESHKDEIKAEKARRKAKNLEVKHAKVAKLKREAAALQVKLAALEKT